MSSSIVQRNIVAFVVGVLFAVGLAIAGMTQPQKVIGFLDLQHWDPSLLFVMMGAVGFHAVAYRLVRRRSSPLLDTEFHVPERNDVTVELIGGAAIFGMGWGLAGFCPGPAIVAIASGEPRAYVFVGAMILGMLVFKEYSPHLSGAKRPRK
ncbi:MAG: DUF6691 family protein [Bdellovibrionota bacterium]